MAGNWRSERKVNSAFESREIKRITSDSLDLSRREHGLVFDMINENLPELVELYGNDCRKVNADIYIDDKAVNPVPYRQAAGLVTLNPYRNPVDETEN